MTTSARLREAERALNARDFRRAHELCLHVIAGDALAADAYFLLAMIAAEHGNYAKAANVIAQAIHLQPSCAEYHAQLGRCLLALSRPGEAYEAAQRALSLPPQTALTLDTAGVILSRVGAHADALEAFSRAVAQVGDRATYRYNLGASLQFLGRFAQAESEYRQALALDPHFCRAWSSLAQVRRAPLSDREVTTLEQLIARDELDVDGQLHLRHALARHCEEREHYGAAFAHLEAGKRRKRASLHYSIERDRTLFSAVTRTCTAEFLARDCGHASDEPIFIVGMPRSGTTLVERILSSHPQVFAAGELTHFALALKRATGTPSNLVLDPDTIEAAAGVDLALVGHAYLDSTRPRTGHTRHFIDKMPLNFLYVGLIRRALPHARIICVRRDPLDTCLSNYRQLFATQFPYYNYAYDLVDTGVYFLMFDALMRRWKELLGDRLYEVRYEAVVTDTESEVRGLLDYCGLEWNPACLRFHENEAPVATASSVQVRQPIYATAMGRWRRYTKDLSPLIKVLRVGLPGGLAGFDEPRCATS